MHQWGFKRVALGWRAVGGGGGGGGKGGVWEHQFSEKHF